MKPAVESEEAFEALMGGCTFLEPNDQPECDPEYGGVLLYSGGWWPYS